MARSGKKGSDTSLPMNPVEFLVLAILKHGPLHGYGIVQEAASRTEGRVRIRPGNLYRVLDRMMDRGLLELSDVSEGEDERRTYYRITRDGRKAVAAEAELLAGILSDVRGSQRPGTETA